MGFFRPQDFHLAGCRKSLIFGSNPSRPGH